MTRMTGPQHADAAEQLLGQYNDILAAVLDNDDRLQVAAALHLAQTQLQAAQVHATLALVSASAANIRRNGPADKIAKEWVG